MRNPIWKKWTKEEDDKLREISALGKYSHSEMGEFLPGRGRHAISFRCRKLEIKSSLPPRCTFKRKYFHDENYFSTKTLETCYYAGILMADGCLSHRGGHYDFIWSVAEKDRQLLEDFCGKINYTGKPKRILVKSPTSDRICPQYRLELFNADKFCYWLINNFGVTENKTYRNVVQNFDNYEQQLAFACGLIDGDGSISWRDKELTTLSISIISSSLPTVEWFQKLVTEMKLPNVSNRDRKINMPDGENSFVYAIAGVEAAFLYKELMLVKVPRLKRKWLNSNILKCLESSLRRWNESPRNPENKLTNPI